MSAHDYSTEHRNTLVRSTGWRDYIGDVLRQVREWKRELILNRALTEGQRLGYQYALEALQEGLKSCYEKAHEQMPEWLEKELMLDGR